MHFLPALFRTILIQIFARDSPFSEITFCSHLPKINFILGFANCCSPPCGILDFGKNKNYKGETTTVSKAKNILTGLDDRIVIRDIVLDDDNVVHLYIRCSQYSSSSSHE